MQLLRPGLFFSFGAAVCETRSSDLIELLSLRVDELDVASRRHVCPIYLGMFRKQREAAENSAHFNTSITSSVSSNSIFSRKCECSECSAALRSVCVRVRLVLDEGVRMTRA